LDWLRQNHPIYLEAKKPLTPLEQSVLEIFPGSTIT